MPPDKPMKVATRFPPHPDSAPGLFYVEEGACMACGMPEREAPELMGHDARGHCYFRRQPSCDEERERALLACVVSCCGAVRYAGSDPQVFRRLGSEATCCDALAGLSPSQVRGRVAAALAHEATREDPLWDPEIDG